MLSVLRKTKPRIEHDSRACDSRVERKLRTLGEVARHFSDDVAIARELDMVSGSAPHMHQHHGAFRSRREIRHFRIVLERGYVIDNRRSGIEGETGDRCAARIDRKRNAEPWSESREHRSHPLQL